MRIAKIIGKVTLSRSVSSFQGAQLKIAVPLMLDDLENETSDDNDILVVYDPHSAGTGEFIALSEGGEAAQPFLPESKPVDAYNAAILDQINLREK
ncbi:MAG: EutN/CcmL family microcompartment protein [Pirellulales bacterium]